MFIAFAIRYGTGNFTAGIAAAAPPGEPVSTVQLDYDVTPGIGSNAIALGSDLTQSGKGILFGNPHYPWHGPARFHMIHTTIPGEIDTMGASLLSGSFVVIGFNRDIAWTHTVSTALRLTLFELELNPGNPMQYRYGDEYRDIESIEVSVPLGDGYSEQTVYMTHHGPVLVSDELPWDRRVSGRCRSGNQQAGHLLCQYDSGGSSRQRILRRHIVDAAPRHGHPYELPPRSHRLAATGRHTGWLEPRMRLAR
jgi:acyl-homoserine-lactone acylase